MANPPFPPFDFDTSAIRGKFDGRLKWLGLLLILLPVFFLSWLGRGIYTDYLWYSQLGYEDIFITVLMTKIILFIVGFIFAFALLLANLFYVNKKILSVQKLKISRTQKGSFFVMLFFFKFGFEFKIEISL